MTKEQRTTIIEVMNIELDNARDRLADVDGDEEAMRDTLGYIAELEGAKKALMDGANGTIVCRGEGESSLDMLAAYDIVFPMEVWDGHIGDDGDDRILQNMEELIEWANREHWEWTIWDCDDEKYNGMRDGRMYHMGDE